MSAIASLLPHPLTAWFLFKCAAAIALGWAVVQVAIAGIVFVGALIVGLIAVLSK